MAEEKITWDATAQAREAAIQAVLAPLAQFGDEQQRLVAKLSAQMTQGAVFASAMGIRPQLMAATEALSAFARSQAVRSAEIAAAFDTAVALQLGPVLANYTFAVRPEVVEQLQGLRTEIAAGNEVSEERIVEAVEVLWAVMVGVMLMAWWRFVAPTQSPAERLAFWLQILIPIAVMGTRKR